MGIDCDLKLIGKSRIKDEYENEISATFVGHTDKSMKLNQKEIEGGKFLTTKEIKELIESENTTPHLADALELYLERSSWDKHSLKLRYSQLVLANLPQML